MWNQLRKYPVYVDDEAYTAYVFSLDIIDREVIFYKGDVNIEHLIVNHHVIISEIPEDTKYFSYFPDYKVLINDPMEIVKDAIVMFKKQIQADNDIQALVDKFDAWDGR